MNIRPFITKTPRLSEMSRRSMLRAAGCGFGFMGLQSLLADTNASTEDPLAPKAPHFPAKAKRVIFLFMTGGVCHVDTFDPKPFLTANHGKERKPKDFYKGSDWKFQKYGKSGIEVSDLFPHVGSVIDDVTLVRSMR